MKITSSRRDDILRDKKEYEEKTAAYKKASDEAYSRYRDAELAVLDPIKSSVITALGDDIGDLNVDVNTAYGRGIRVTIGNDRGYSRKGDNASLTWSWEATINSKGEVSKESSSWSGLNAVTPAQVEDLKQCVRQLEIINNLDWEDILNVQLPDYDDYQVDMERPTTNRDFNLELFEAEVEDLVGASSLVKGKMGVGKYYNGVVYFGIVKDSGTQYTVFEIPARWIEEIEEKGSFSYAENTFTTVRELVDYFDYNTYRVRKINFTGKLEKPINVLDY